MRRERHRWDEGIQSGRHLATQRNLQRRASNCIDIDLHAIMHLIVEKILSIQRTSHHDYSS